MYLFPTSRGPYRDFESYFRDVALKLSCITYLQLFSEFIYICWFDMEYYYIIIQAVAYRSSRLARGQAEGR